jgi:D-arabinose 1-dehydrogenase-like Zn-dependent alcohol dehydrogenase
MKAAIVESPGKLLVRDIPSPQPGPYGALCQLLYGATCSGTDLHLIADKMPWKVQYPMVLGHESVGRVIAVGEKVRTFKIGDLVSRVGTPPVPEIGMNISWGGFCELGVAFDHRAMRQDGLPAEQWKGYRIHQVIPSQIHPAAATMTITWRETLSYSRRLGITKGSKVLVLGSGGNALAFISHARNLGATHIATTGSPSRADVSRAAGATHVLDYRDPDLESNLRSACGKFDVLIDAVGKSGEVDRVLPLLRSGAVIGIYGLDDFDNLKISPLRASGSFTVYADGYDEEETHDEVMSRIVDGSLDASIWLDLEHPFDLDHIADAFDAIRSKRLVKALIKLSAD